MSDIWVVARVYAPDEGGVQTYAVQVAEAYVRSGRRVTVFAKSSAGPRREVTGNLTLVDVGPGAQLVVYGKLALALARAWFAGPRPQAIHACTWRAAIPALAFPRPLIATVHGREVGRPRAAALRLMTLVLRRCARVVAVSDATRALLLARAPDLAGRCITAWNGVVVPPAPRETPANARPRVITVCRMVARKNVPAAMRAVAACRETGTALDHAVIGRGPEDAAVKAALGPSPEDMGTTEVTGYIDDAALAERYRTADIFLHPQIALEDGAEMEGFGISVADAMAHGIPCVVGRDGGPGELVRDGVDGLVVDGSDPADIRAAVELLARSAPYRARLGANARAFALENFSWDRHCGLALDGLAGQPAPATSGKGEQLRAPSA